MLILGIDPGTAETGWGIIEVTGEAVEGNGSKGISYIAHGSLKTRSGEATSTRLLSLKLQFEEITKKHVSLNCVVIEKLFFGRNVQTAMSVERARGVIMVASAERSLECFEYQPLVVKKILTGSGKSDKLQVEEAVAKFLGLSKLPTPNHAADALAIAICHALRKNFYVPEVRKMYTKRDLDSGKFLPNPKKINKKRKKTE